MSDVFIVPEEDRTLVVVEEERTIDVPAEARIIEVTKNMNIGSKIHTQDDTKRWTVQYDKWLANTAVIDQFEVESSSDEFTVGSETILGTEAAFFISGGTANERTTLTLTMTDTLGNIKHDTVIFTCVAA